MPINHSKIVQLLKDFILKKLDDKFMQNIFGKDSYNTIQNLTAVNINYLKSFAQYSEKGATTYIQRSYLPAKQQQQSCNTKSQDKGGTCLPRWRNKTFMSKCSVSSQTHHAILGVKTAENNAALLSRIEALITHFHQYPESRNSAIRAGAIRLLLRIRKKTTKIGNIQEAARECLAILGYSDPVMENGIRILSMDGGGIRGLLILEMLKKLEELTGKRTHELFDLICGVSTGAILAFSLGIHHTNLDEVAEGYKDISMEVFKQSPLWGTGSLVWNQAYYDTSLWENKLRQHLGTDSLIKTARNLKCPKLCAVSTVVNQSQLSAYVFRNYSLPWRVKSQYCGGNNHEVWQAARASAAAPTYFEEFKLGSFLHQDGGILVNNPTAVALHEAKLIWPNTPIQCVVSFGTGRTIPSPANNYRDSSEDCRSTSWTNKFYKILDSATDTEGVHLMLGDLLPNSIYYRFNPYLSEMISMVEFDTLKLEQLKRDAIMYLRRNEDKFQEAAKVLSKKKTYLQKLNDLINSCKELYGL